MSKAGTFSLLLSLYITVDGFTTSTIVVGEITALKHKVRNDTMETTRLVAKAFFTSTESTEVLGSLGNYISVEFKDNFL